MENNQKVLKVISKLKIYIGPFINATIGAKVPFYTDSRDIYSHPKIWKVLVDELAKIIKKYIRNGKKIDLLIGTPMAGIALAAALSIKTRIPLVYLNTKRKKFLRKRLIEGDYQKGAKAILIDDTIGFGQTKLKAIKACKKDGVLVRHVLCFYNSWYPKNKPFLNKLKQMNITFDALCTRKEWMLYLYQKGILSKNAYDIHKAYLNNPKSWHKNKYIWQRFLIWRQEAIKTGKL
jgi:orotate phosphoribosyltransferase